MPATSSLTNLTFSFILFFQKSQSWYNVSIRFSSCRTCGAGGTWRSWGMETIECPRAACGLQQTAGPRRVGFSLTSPSTQNQRQWWSPGGTDCWGGRL